MTDTDPREPQPIGMEQWPAQAVPVLIVPPVVEVGQTSSPTNTNSDLLRMLRASLDRRTLYERILAWANARRDAAVETTKTRNISNADLVARLKHHAEWSAGPNELRAAEFEETAEIIELLPEIITVLSVLHETPDPRDAQIARLREALEAARAHNRVLSAAIEALSGTEARDA